MGRLLSFSFPLRQRLLRQHKFGGVRPTGGAHRERESPILLIAAQRYRHRRIGFKRRDFSVFISSRYSPGLVAVRATALTSAGIS